MPQINFAEAFAEENAAVLPHPIEPARDFQLPAETAAFVEPARFRTTRLRRSEWANILFAGISIAGGLFCAFYFFNGADLVRAALTRPGEYLYSRPLPSDQNTAVATKSVPEEGPLPGTLPNRRSFKTDPSGDPFSRTNKLITIDRSLRSFPRGGGGLTAGSPRPSSGSPVPPGVFTMPGVPGGPVGALPGPVTLVARLTLLFPGDDALTHALRTAAASVSN